ncbi:MAG: class I SAM-dependent methyltransferase [Candidatus Falkowbacteria bacterium]|nr:class I SAM-dependent methyltransferase [Candidatus Falkowbacteria bacterium]
MSGSDNERVLDIGCGAYPYFLTKLNFKEKYGIDQSAAKKIPGVDLKQIDFKDSPLPWSDNYFDAITMLAVIEHLDVETAKKLLKDIYRLLKPGGRLVITTPSSGADKLLRLLAKMKLISSEEINDHKQFYTKKLIREQLIESGWSNESISIGYFQIAYNIWALAKK